jgi:pimeloyl-ACP methyl ester carboxylesterase
MPTFHNGTIETAYLDEGEGEPIVLVHGFASSIKANWLDPGWVATLTRAGRRVIAFDHRGHGDSTKLYRPEDYRIPNMVDDLLALLDHLKIERADIMGYSMGGRVTATTAVRAPERVRSAILGGIGMVLVTMRETGGDTIAAALEAPSLDDVEDETGRTFRRFAEATKSDLKALAACMRGSRQALAPADLKRIAAPVLIAVGTTDDVAGSPRELAMLLPNAQVLDIPNRDHMRAVGDRVFKEGVLAFLKDRP